MRELLVVVWCTLLVAGCVNSANVPRPLPAAHFGSVAVLPMEGPHGDLMADRITYELLNRGVDLVTQQAISKALRARGQHDARFGVDTPLARLAPLAKQLHVDTVVVGSVSDQGGGETVVDQLRGIPGYKVARASIKFVRASNGASLASADYNGKGTFSWLTDTYYDVARKLVNQVFDRQ